MCRVTDIQQMHENYVRGVLRLETQIGYYEQLALHQYISALDRLRHDHNDVCQCGRPRQVDISELTDSVDVP